MNVQKYNTIEKMECCTFNEMHKTNHYSYRLQPANILNAYASMNESFDLEAELIGDTSRHRQMQQIA